MSGVEYKDIAPLVEGLGWVILPTKRGEKHPWVNWRKYQEEKPSQRTMENWFPKGHPGGAWLLTGPSGVAGLDPDCEPAHQWWIKRVPSLATAPRSATGKCFHYFFSVPEELRGSPELKDRVHKDSETDPEKMWDFRGEGGLILPPSWHKDRDTHYSWDTDEARGNPMLPFCEFPSVRDLLVVLNTTGQRASAGDRASSDDFDLDEAIHKLRTMETGGRNNLFKDIAMSFMRQSKGSLAMTSTSCRLIFDAMENKDDFTWDGDCMKAILSAQQTYNASLLAPATTVVTKSGKVRKLPHTGLLSGPRTGHLGPSVENNTLVECIDRKNKNGTTVSVYANFVFEAVSVLLDDTKRTYVVNIHTNEGVVHYNISLASDILASPVEFGKWLLNFNCYLFDVKDKLGSYKDSIRIDMFLTAQDPPQHRVAHYLGVQEDGDGGVFLTHDGIITKDGQEEYRDFKPSPRLTQFGYAPYKYLFEGDMKEALVTFATILTLHDSDATCVYASRFAALLHKADLMDRGGIGFFPICGLEAPSGSGKTSGFFGFMNQLSGCTLGPMVATPAMIRNRISGHRNVDVFIDDKTMNKAEAGAIQEVFRNATTEGAWNKTDTRDNVSAIAQKMIGSVLQAGEGLGIRSEKALLDRYIMLSIKSPVGRKTMRRDRINGPDQEQDVIAMRRHNPARFSGWLVQRALQCRRDDIPKMLSELTGKQTQRQGAKMFTLRYGARVLLDMLSPLREGDTWCQEVLDAGADVVIDTLIDRVDKWCTQTDETYDPNLNTLNEFLAECAVAFAHHTFPEKGENGRLDTPMFLTACQLYGGSTCLWFRFDLCITSMRQRRTYEQDLRVRNEASLRQQLDHSFEGEFKAGVQHRIKNGGPNSNLRWYVLSPEATDKVLIAANIEHEKLKLHA